MKKTLLVLLIVSILFSLTACNSEQTSTYKIGIAAPDDTHGWVAGVAYYAEKYCQENHIDYKVVTSCDTDEMTESLNELVSWGADAIVTYPQWTGMESTVQKIIQEDGIPVVSFDIRIDVPGVYTVTGDNEGMGYRSAVYIQSRVSDAAHIIVMDVPSSGSVGALRKQGFYQYLSSIGYDTSNITEVECTAFTRDEGLMRMREILNTHETVDAVFSYDDEISIGCVQAIMEVGRTDIKAITGGGGMQEYFQMIENDQYAEFGLASALYSPMMIQNAIQYAINICEGQLVDANLIIPTKLVKRDNVSEYLDPDNTIY